ncbi:MAG: DNA-binding response OmpR family regulator [Marinobacter psychrophilus]|jgi:DNA-binding response OmpR family regulator
MRIALLEDGPEQSQHEQGIICRRRQSCDAFETGQHFLSVVLHNNNDLLVLNCQISGMSGLSRRNQQAQSRKNQKPDKGVVHAQVMAAHD